jgi:glycosyl transferase family 25
MIYYINLSHRTDRKQQVEEELVKIDIDKFQRFDAIEKEDGRIGCSMSHLELLKMARTNDLPYIIIVEDDIQFINPILFKNQFQKFLKSREQWDVLLFGGNNYGSIRQTNPYTIKITNCLTTTGYMVSRHYYDTLISNIEEGLEKLIQYPTEHYKYAIDVYWQSLQKKDEWHLIYPLIVVQRPGYSDIEKTHRDYTKLMVR